MGNHIEGRGMGTGKSYAQFMNLFMFLGGPGFLNQPAGLCTMKMEKYEADFHYVTGHKLLYSEKGYNHYKIIGSYNPN